ncbi:hypothetical protein AMECASPLE_022553 [Ameca splendens]|uniref:Uncharacterized protein n=1 Tax=Ameca splendens TaxID=208324 RepID=A0ABV0XGW7_9TELE
MLRLGQLMEGTHSRFNAAVVEIHLDLRHWQAMPTSLVMLLIQPLQAHHYLRHCQTFHAAVGLTRHWQAFHAAVGLTRHWQAFHAAVGLTRHWQAFHAAVGLTRHWQAFHAAVRLSQAIGRHLQTCLGKHLNPKPCQAFI